MPAARFGSRSPIRQYIPWTCSIAHQCAPRHPARIARRELEYIFSSSRMDNLDISGQAPNGVNRNASNARPLPNSSRARRFANSPNLTGSMWSLARWNLAPNHFAGSKLSAIISRSICRSFTSQARRFCRVSSTPSEIRWRHAAASLGPRQRSASLRRLHSVPLASRYRTDSSRTTALRAPRRRGLTKQNLRAQMPARTLPI